MPLLLLLLGLGLGLGLVVLDRRLDRVLRKHGAVELDRGKLEVLGNVRVLDGEALLDGLPLDPLGGNRAGGDGRATAKSFELALDDAALVVDLDLKLHDVAASRRADEASADGALVLVERAHVARVLVVVEERLSVFRVGSNKLECRGPRRAGRAGRARASRHSREHLAAACRLPVCPPACLPARRCRVPACAPPRPSVTSLWFWPSLLSLLRGLERARLGSESSAAARVTAGPSGGSRLPAYDAEGGAPRGVAGRGEAFRSLRMAAGCSRQ
mmetsp:Transcript_24621/g.69500  ORF Transcript_24621/g.69500 Transcript_24621/m.69500 type:complete len:272 (+) Transcript_24621:1539-2354(+)